MHCGPYRRQRRRSRHTFRPRVRLFGAGEVRLALLSLLEERPKHGYELMKELEERSDGVYRASAGTVYPTLQQLADEGLVVSETQDGRRAYRLTDAGRVEIEREREAIDRIWRRTERLGDWGDVFDPEAAELVRPVLRLLRTVVRTAARRGDDPAVIERVRDILERTQEEIRALRREH